MAKSAWIDQVVTNLKGSSTPLALDALTFVESNYLPLDNLGLDAFNEVLGLINSGQSETAIDVLDANMGPEDCIAAENANAAGLNAAVAQYAKFKSDLVTVAAALIPVVATVAKVALTGGIGGLA